MTATAGAPGALTLDGVASTVGGRHAFVRERVLALVARETERSGGLSATKRDLAELLGCDVISVDGAIKRLRREGAIVSAPRFDESGGQLANVYRTTS